MSKNKKKIYKVMLLLLFVGLFFLVTSHLPMVIQNILVSPEPFGADWNNFHIKIIEAYSKGDFSRFFNYPPLFHLMLVPLVWLNLIPYVKYLQIIFYLSAIGSSMFLAYKLNGKVASIIMGIILFSSLAFLDRSIQVIPQAIEFIIFPLVILLYNKKKFKTVGLLLLILSYSHSMGIVFTLILFFYTLTVKRNYDKMYLILILAIPSLIWFPFGLNPATELSSNAKILLDPLSQIFYASPLFFSFLIVSMFSMFSSNSPNPEKHYLFFLWFLVFTPLAFTLIDRWLQYILVPLIMLFMPYFLNFLKPLGKVIK